MVKYAHNYTATRVTTATLLHQSTSEKCMSLGKRVDISPSLAAMDSRKEGFKWMFEHSIKLKSLT